ncbi:hypothetical protein FVE85_9349 [Porphyridium purpureum]|uniref:Uncharacterized protein n=1 Tax=Porphyridium purpureum TaxID=35688 RepID=A0A5J4YRN3_PORPP|nr:hypothetical protein FVE85_9349 [Porphyridium purpureum]|eukprot:POR5965..scf222_8
MADLGRGALVRGAGVNIGMSRSAEISSRSAVARRLRGDEDAPAEAVVTPALSSTVDGSNFGRRRRGKDRAKKRARRGSATDIFVRNIVNRGLLPAVVKVDDAGTGCMDFWRKFERLAATYDHREPYTPAASPGLTMFTTWYTDIGFVDPPSMMEDEALTTLMQESLKGAKNGLRRNIRMSLAAAFKSHLGTARRVVDYITRDGTVEEPVKSFACRPFLSSRLYRKFRTPVSPYGTSLAPLDDRITPNEEKEALDIGITWMTAIYYAITQVLGKYGRSILALERDPYYSVLCRELKIDEADSIWLRPDRDGSESDKAWSSTLWSNSLMLSLLGLRSGAKDGKDYPFADIGLNLEGLCMLQMHSLFVSSAQARAPSISKVCQARDDTTSDWHDRSEESDDMPGDNEDEWNIPIHWETYTSWADGKLPEKGFMGILKCIQICRRWFRSDIHSIQLDEEGRICVRDSDIAINDGDLRLCRAIRYRATQLRLINCPRASVRRLPRPSHAPTVNSMNESDDIEQAMGAPSAASAPSFLDYMEYSGSDTNP